MIFSSIDDLTATLFLMITSTVMYYVTWKLKESPDVKDTSSYVNMLDDASFMFAHAIPVSLIEFAVPDELLSVIFPTASVIGGLGIYAFTTLDDIPALMYLIRGASKLKKVAIAKSGNTIIKLKILKKLEQYGGNFDSNRLSKIFCKKYKEDEFEQALNALKSFKYIEIEKKGQIISITDEGRKYLLEMQPLIKKVLRGSLAER